MAGLIPNTGKIMLAKMAKGDYNLSSETVATLTQSIGVTHCALGTGGGAPGAETSTLTTLNNEVCRKHFYRRVYLTTTASSGDYLIHGTNYVESATATPTLGIFFRFQGTEGAFDGVDEIGIYGNCDYVTPAVTTASPSGSVGDDICTAGGVFRGATNAVYTLTIVQGGSPGTASDGAQYTATGSLGDITESGAITSFDEDCAVGTYGATVRFTENTSGDGAVTLDNAWQIYCTSNAAGRDYASGGVWSVDNYQGEVSDPGDLYSVEYVTDFNKVATEDYQYVYILWFDGS